MSKSKLRLLGGMVVAATGMTLAPPAWSSMATDSGALEEIVVTARKRVESVQKVPEAVSAISAAQIEQTFQSSANGLSGVAPSLVFDRVVSGPATAAISIRGIGFSDVEKSFDPAVGVVIDGIYLGTSTGQTFQVFDLERLEVLRGPQGTLFGKNTIGGAISVVRSEPTGELSGKMRAGAGSRNRRNFEGILNLPSIGDQLAVKLSYTNRQQDGEAFNLFTQKTVGGTDYESVGTTFKWTPNDALKVVYSFQREDDDTPIPGLSNTSLNAYQAPSGIVVTDLLCTLTAFCSLDGAGVVPQSGDARIVNFNGSNDQTYVGNSHTLAAEWKLSEGYTVNYLFGLRRSSEATNQDFDATPFDFFQTLRQQSFEQKSHELRLTYDQGGRFNIVGGLYLWDAGYTLKQSSWVFGRNPLTQTPSSIQNVKHDTHSYAVFAQSDINLTNEWIATLGGRYTNEEKEMQIDALVGLPNGTFGSPSKRSWSEFTPKAGIRWQFLPEQMVYLSYSTGFRSGGFNGRAGTLNAATKPYDPETVNSIELGYKSQWLDDHLRFNANVFLTDYKDKQEDIVFPCATCATGNETLTVNAAKAKYKGVELEVVAIPVEGWTLRGNASFLDAKYDEFCASSLYNAFNVAPSCGPGLSDYSGLTLRRAPKQTYALDSTNVWSIGPGELSFNISGRYKSEYYTTVQNIPLGLVKAATILDSSLTFSMGDVSISGWVHNLTDKTVQNSALKVASLWSFSTYNMPREYGVDLTYKFGAK